MESMDRIRDDDDTDYILVYNVLGGDTDSFAIIISNTEKLIAQIIYKLIPNNEDRKDIAQDVYLKAFNKLETFKFQSKLSTWIAKIAYNTCLSYLDKKKLLLVYDFETEHEKEGYYLSKNHNDYREEENNFFKKELSQIINKEIEKLSPIFKTLITLFHTEELSYEEIAQITQLPEGTIKSYLFRARKILKDNILQKYTKEEL